MPASEIALLVSDGTLIVADQILERASRVQWSQLDDLSEPDETHPDLPTAHLYDRAAWRFSAPASEESEWWVLVDLGPQGTPDVFDAIGIIAHTIDFGPDAYVAIWASDAADFAGAVLVDEPDVLTDRILSLPATRYTGYRYLGIQMAWTAPTQPTIGEIWIGQRRQLPRPDSPHDPHALVTERIVSSRRGAVDLDPNQGVYGARAPSGVYRTFGPDTLRSIRDESELGVASVLVTPAPSSAPEETLICEIEPMVIGVAHGHDYYQAELKFREIYPMTEGF